MPVITSTLEEPGYRAFVDHLIWLRKNAGVTQAQLATELNKPQSYVSKTERFLRRIDPAEFRAFVLAIGGDPAKEFAAVSSRLGEEATLG